MDEPGDDIARDNALAALIEVELRIGDEVAAAQADASQMLETAHEEAAAHLQQAREELAKAESALRARIAEEGEAAVREIETGATSQAEHYAQTDAATLRSVARWLASHVAQSGLGS